MTKWTATLFTGLVSFGAWAYNPNEINVDAHVLPSELQGVGVDEHLGAKIDLGLEFTDENGNLVSLGSFFHDPSKPVLMAMVYYSCPSLCNHHLNGLTTQLKNLKWTSGRDFQIVAVSMNHEETPDLAQAKKLNYLKEYGRPDGEAGWHFLVGSKENIAKLAGQLGFKFQWLEEKKQFAHAAVAYVLTPEGKISRYLHGVMPEQNTIRMSLLEASNGKIGSMVEKVLMFCFEFDPKKGKYTLYAWNIMRIGAILMVLLLGVLIVPAWFRENSKKRT